jgi:phosphopantetheine adenylyltransferase
MDRLEQVNNEERAELYFRENEVNAETCLAYDYLNELYKIINPLHQGLTGEELCARFKERPLEYYETRFRDYPHLVTDQNREAIQEINSLVDKVNTTTADAMLSKEELEEIMERIKKIVRG